MLFQANISDVVKFSPIVFKSFKKIPPTLQMISICSCAGFLNHSKYFPKTNFHLVTCFALPCSNLLFVNFQLLDDMLQFELLSHKLIIGLLLHVTLSLLVLYLCCWHIRLSRLKHTWEPLQVLHKAMKGLGTDDTTLTRIIVTRAEIDLQYIKQEYRKKYGKTLNDAVHSETSGHYKAFLLALLGPNH